MPYGSLLADVVQSSATGTPPQFNDTNGTQTGTLCRAWVNFNGTSSGTIAPRASFNVTSVTKVSTGQYTVNITNAMPDANYAAVCTVSSNGAGVSTQTIATGEPGTARTTTAFRILTFSGAGASFNDFDIVSAAVFR